MNIVTIYSRHDWRVTSFGNGWGYLLGNVANQTSVWFQDEDASAFRAKTMDNEGRFFDNVEELFADYREIMHPNEKTEKAI